MQPGLRFPEEKDAFYATVKDRVNLYFSQSNKNKYAGGFFYFKSVVFISIHIALYFLTLNSQSTAIAITSYVLMGPMSILIGINLAHDGTHGAISKMKFINTAFTSLLDILGANSYMWKNRHVYSHHLYPNILNHDADLKQNPMVRIFPGDEIKPLHKIQYLYAPFLYLLYTLNWLLFRDFQDYTRKNIGSFQNKKNKYPQIIKLICSKTIYLSYILVIPMFYSVLTWEELIIGYLLMNFLASIMITLALIPSHVAETSYFPIPNENGLMPHPWSHHQVLTVIDFATDNMFLNFFFGGFNHHVAHHLFPTISHTHYPAITPIIRRTIEEFGLKYNYEDSFTNAYISHFKLLKNNGKAALKNITT